MYISYSEDNRTEQQTLAQTTAKHKFRRPIRQSQAPPPSSRLAATEQLTITNNQRLLLTKP